mmetsp:Transcript_8489/g.27948  ORF Transcript_8489/g.27948 Transcript_8489/m.27948 type:complete len:90 (-) Transcript_8489:119-388(-)
MPFCAKDASRRMACLIDSWRAWLAFVVAEAYIVGRRVFEVAWECFEFLLERFVECFAARAQATRQSSVRGRAILAGGTVFRPRYKGTAV